MDEQSIFLEALAIESPDDRAAFLDQACAGNDGLRASVEALLAAHAKASGFLAKPAVELAETVARPMAETAGSQIGPYKLMEKIGEGGFGQVFVAEQQQPVRRKVALKIIKPGMDTREVIARFEAERQALALMDHPNIAKVLDAGSTDTGRPYFVMELVRGVSITDYCDQTRLNSRERLDLFVSVCQAVQHAHQKGIIHRDIKPSNVLVSLHDGRPVAKVIDFGVAKAINQQLTDNTVYTKFTQLIGTPLYMSPEQAEMSGLDIDTRTDVYSLGVLLYELLTGTTPFDKRRMAKAAFDEIRRIIREEEPPKPSTRLSESGDALPSIAAKRHTEPAKLSKMLRGDLDWIVMKALEKDRTRRYETANGLARDVQRYLSDEPVEACPPSKTYRLRKFARKNKTIISTAGVFGALLILGTVFSVWQAVRATRAQTLADTRLVDLERANDATLQALADTRDAKKQTEIALAKSEEERGVAQAITEFLTGVFRLSDPLEDGRDLKVVDAFDAALKEIDTALPNAPDAIKGRLIHAVGVTYLGLGVYDKAVDVLERAYLRLSKSLGTDDPQTLHCQSDLAVAHGRAGDPAKSLVLAKHVLTRRQIVLPKNDLQTLLSMTIVACAEREAGDPLRAEPQFEAALALLKVHPESDDHKEYTLECMRQLAHCYLLNRKFDEAFKLFEETLALSKQAFSDDSAFTLDVMGDLAVAHGQRGHLLKAIDLCRQTLAARGLKLGLTHPATLLNEANLAGMLGRNGDYEAARDQYKRTLAAMQAHLAPNHPIYLATLVECAAIHLGYRRLDEGLATAQDAFDRCVQRYGSRSPRIVDALAVLARAHLMRRDLNKARKLYQEGFEILQNNPVTGKNERLEIDFLESAAMVDSMSGEVDAAIEKLVRLYQRRKELDGEQHSDTRQALRNLCEVYIRNERWDAAAPLLHRLHAAEKTFRDESDGVIATTGAQLGAALIGQGKSAEALGYLEHAAQICDKYAPRDMLAIDVRILRGKCLVALERYAEAKDYLEQAYRELQMFKAQAPATLDAYVATNVIRCLELLVKANHGLGDLSAVAKYQRELEKLHHKAPRAPEPDEL